jgi:uncharacterized protein (TIGR02996 family)
VPERDDLLAAIRANPDDDTPRLVFADWLDENEPDAKLRKGATGPSAWAALIRAECAFARLREGDSAAGAVYDFFDEFDDQTFKGVRWPRVLPEMARLVELLAAAGRVRAKARTALNALFPPNAGFWWSLQTHRGFPASVFFTRAKKPAPGRFDRLPAFDLRFGFRTRESEALVREWVAAGLLRNVRALALPADRDDLMPVLSVSEDTVGVRRFVVSRGSSSAGATAFVQWLTGTANWAGLRDLRFDVDELLNNDDAARLFRSPSLRRLTRLHIPGDRNWSARTVEGLAAFTDLRDLRLIGCGLDDAAAERLADMPGLANLRTLNLTDNNITGVGASALLASRHLKNLTVLDFENNPCRGLDRAALAHAPAGGLRALAVQNCRFTAADVTALTTSPRVSELLYFSACESLREPLLARLVKGFGDRAPAVLYLRRNGVSTAGAEVLANWPAAARIDMLHLQGNRLSTVGAKALAGCPHLKHLTHLCTGTTHAAGRKALMACFGRRVRVL